MAETIKIRKIGGSLGLILPKKIAEALALREGDELFISATQESLNISPYDPEFSEALEDARAFMRTHRDAFRALAQ